MPFKNIINTFNQTGSQQDINAALTLYTNEIIPLTKTIRDLKYDVCYVECIDSEDRSGDTYILTQKKSSLFNLEYALWGQDKVRSFVKGVKGFKPNSNKKKRPIIELVEVTETEEPVISLKQGEPIRQDVEFEITEIDSETNPRYNDDGTISWVDINNNINKKYQDVWVLLKPEYKLALIKDQQWMKKTMDSFIEFNKLRTEKKLPYGANRQFIHPDGLLLPPVKISDNEYDYGNAYYNSILNIPNSTPGIWLTFLPDRNVSTISYANKNPFLPYLDALAAIIGRKVQFTTV
jgi:hypothetical protein